jgi:hypothetical protein
MSFNWWYTLPTMLVEGAVKVSESAAMVAMFWMALVKVGRGTPSQWMVVVTVLA